VKDFAGDVVRELLAQSEPTAASESAASTSADSARPVDAGIPSQSPPPESAKKWHAAVLAASTRTHHELKAADSPRDVRYASDDPSLDRLWQALCEVADPELPISLVDLGLIHAVRCDGGRVEVDLTFTASACPCMEFIIEDVKERLLREPDVDDVIVTDVWDPPWTNERMTEHGRALLRRFGVAA
jgi:metal-sulfur cluster biosynthetic enzyme